MEEKKTSVNNVAKYIKKKEKDKSEKKKKMQKEKLESKENEMPIKEQNGPVIGQSKTSEPQKREHEKDMKIRGINFDNGKKQVGINDTILKKEKLKKKKRNIKSNEESERPKKKSTKASWEKKKEKDEMDEDKNTTKDDDGSIDMDEEEDSSSSDEDNEGLLLTDKFKKKFSNLLYSLKNNDQNLINKNEEFFHESDFELESTTESANAVETEKETNEKKDETEKEKEDDSMNFSNYYTKILLKEGAEAYYKEEEEEEKMMEKEQKKLTKKKHKSYFEEQDELRKNILEACKQYDKASEEKEANDDEDFFKVKEKSEKEKKEEESYFENFVHNSKISKEEDYLLKEYWKDNLSKEDEFLRDYILKEMWKEGNVNLEYTEVDEIDDEHLNQAEKFEQEYNFRFEENDGTVISAIPRKVDSSLRIDAKKQKKKEQKARRLKKKAELKRMILEKHLEEEKNKKNKKKVTPKNEEEEEEEEEKKNVSSDHNKRKNEVAEEKEEPNEKKKNETSDQYYWYICDGCNKTLSAFCYVYECTVCDNFALCKLCYKYEEHPHEMNKILIPLECEPPKKKNVSVTKNDENKENDNKKKQKGTDNTSEAVIEHDKLPDMTENDEFEYLEHDSSCYEDLIENMPVRFKYVRVKPKRYGFSTIDILQMDEKKLNKNFPIKHAYAYYTQNDESQKNGFHRRKKKKKERKRSTSKHKTQNKEQGTNAK